ncbi:putative cell division control protein 42 [Paratrimastix pyriformis]|uniref:Cell division control protein 42 n=1 Tax=Paratrimastix pyriformis TaxID=342808 RepID=A0ABQ8URB8_9EUKA|nr:putative cell division control protein 42 [Paratrimastix pyriformis]
MGQARSKFPLNDLPNEILVSIFRYVGDNEALASWMMVCHRWHVLLLSTSCWALLPGESRSFAEYYDRQLGTFLLNAHPRPKRGRAISDLKCVVVGPCEAGKTSLIIRLVTEEFPLPSESAPKRLFENYSRLLMFGGVPYNIQLWDTTGHEDYDRLRPLSYVEADLFLMCFAVGDRIRPSACQGPAFTALIVRRRLGPSATVVPEVCCYCPKAPVLLVGCRSDLRAGTARWEPDEVRYSECLRLVKEAGLVGYTEVSAKSGTALGNFSEVAIMAALEPMQTKEFFQRVWRPTPDKASAPFEFTTLADLQTRRGLRAPAPQ